MPTFIDKVLNCCDCNTSFVFSADEQQFFASKELLNEPKRCNNCRVIVRLKRDGKSLEQAFRIVCEACGAAAVVPFRPTGRKPVYCSSCLRVKAKPVVAELQPAG